MWRAPTTTMGLRDSCRPSRCPSRTRPTNGRRRHRRRNRARCPRPRWRGRRGIPTDLRDDSASLHGFRCASSGDRHARFRGCSSVGRGFAGSRCALACGCRRAGSRPHCDCPRAVSIARCGPPSARSNSGVARGLRGVRQRHPGGSPKPGRSPIPEPVRGELGRAVGERTAQCGATSGSAPGDAEEVADVTSAWARAGVGALARLGAGTIRDAGFGGKLRTGLGPQCRFPGQGRRCRRRDDSAAPGRAGCSGMGRSLPRPIRRASSPVAAGCCEGRLAVLGRLPDGSCEALLPVDGRSPPEGRCAVDGTRPPPPEGCCEGREA